MPTYHGDFIKRVELDCTDSGEDHIFITDDGGGTVTLGYDECMEMLRAIRFLAPTWVRDE